MKNLCYIFFVVLLLGGCQKGQVEPNPLDVAQLAINPSIEGMAIATSRAAGTDTDLKSDGFYLAGYYTTGLIADVASDDLSPNVFAKDASDLQDPVPLVRYTDNKFTLKTIKWQLDDQSYLGFFGWAQSKAIPTTGITSTTTGIIGQTKNVDDKGYPWIEIRNADAPSDQTDVVGARSIDHRNDAVISSVDLDFRHLLSKISFVAKSSSGAKVVISSAKIKYAAGKVYKRARYTFGSDAVVSGAYGKYAEYHTGTVALSGSVTINGTSSVALGSGALLIPQALAAGDVSLELTYAISPNGTLVGTTQTKTLPLSAVALGQGNHYLYTIDLQATEIVLSTTPTIEAWSYLNTSLPLIAGPKGNTQLLLDGYQKPYQHIDGKWYWLDRSGYNRHCEIVGYNSAMYSAADHSYTFNNTTNRYLIVPSLNSTKALSVSVIAQQTPGAKGSQSLIHLSNGTTGTRPFFTHMGYDGSTTLYFDTGVSNGTSGRLRYDVSSNSVFEQKTLWTFQKQDVGIQSIYRNASSEALTGTTSTVALSVLQGVIGSEYAGSVSYVNIVGAILSEAEVAQEYKMGVSRFGVQDNVVIYPPVRDGLKIWLDGYNAPKNIDGKLVWQDNGTSQNHAELMNNQVEWAIDGSYVFAGGGYMQLVKSLVETGVTANSGSKITIELVFIPEKGHSATEGLLRICNDLNAYPGDQIWKGSFSGVGYQAQSEYGENRRYRTFLDGVSVPEKKSHSFVWANGQGTGTNIVYLDGAKYTGNGGSSAGHTWCLIGCANSPTTNSSITQNFFTGKIKALRIYNRLLTEAEILRNYRFDKEYYGLSD